ncbi:MAG: hypothetical protein LC667_06150 [Thioalkalivibrio sp.]|nr:hypothetical protein [Thioalkalivibrio sp.]
MATTTRFCALLSRDVIVTGADDSGREGSLTCLDYGDRCAGYCAVTGLDSREMGKRFARTPHGRRSLVRTLLECGLCGVPSEVLLLDPDTTFCPTCEDEAPRFGFMAV